MSPDERLAVARDLLQEARLDLVTAQTLLNDAASQSVWDVAGVTMDHGRAKQSSAGAAARHMRMAQQLASDAVETLKMIAAVGEPIDFDMDSVLFALDTAWLTDGILLNGAAHVRIERARTQANRMLKRVEGLLLTISPNG